ncbi:MAG TPA: acylase [Chitinophaga sp.]|uniref:acylase n=1 Tax=Chitinophaga sp. TaxID=1869181 RepID=UPI002F952C79
MHFLKRWMFAILPLILAATACAQQPPGTEVLWDTYGVPHVYGKSLAGMYYGFGWAQMHNHANLLLQLYGQARGRSAEYWGEKNLLRDEIIHLFNIPQLAKEHYARQNPVFKSCLDAFVKGVNAYAKAHPEAIGEKFKQVLPIQPTDVTAHALRVLYIQFLAIDDIDEAMQVAGRGSNAIAIGPSRSASRNAMLLANPHLPWADLYLFFEAQLSGPGYNAYGATLIGMPTLAIAFNEHLGWTHTVNTIDASDRYILQLKDSNTYILDNKPVRFLQKNITLKVKKENGSLQSQTIPLLYSKQGPVIMGKNGEAYAVRIAGMERPDMMYQWHQMGAAGNWAQFEAALKLMQLPMFNVMYADDAGNINYFFAGNVPVRAQGNWDFWQQPVDGSKSTYIWQQTHPYKDLPKLHNPSTGFLQNANDPPWTCTYPALLAPASYPSYMASRNTGLRPQRALNMIRKDSSITYEELIADKYNTGMEAADRYLDELLAAVKQYPDTAATRAAVVLQQWDRATDTASTGALLFTHWFDKLKPGMIRTPFDPAQPVTTPAGLKDPAGAVKLLAAAAAEVQQQYGRLDVPWGSQARMRFNKRNYAGNGGAGHYGIFRVIDYQEDEDKKYTAYGGDSYVAIVEFSKPLKAQVLLSYGNATQPGNKHLGDQLQLLSQKKLRTPWLQRSEVMEHLEERETP